MITRRFTSASSAAATRPAIPAPTMTTSVVSVGMRGHGAAQVHVIPSARDDTDSSDAACALSLGMDTGRPQTLGEEIANSITHGVGFLLSVAALPILIVIAVRHGDAWRVTAASIYGATLVLLYAASTLYHALPGERVKEVFRRCDHAAIY